MQNTELLTRQLNAATLPASAFAVLLLGIASNHTHAGLVTDALYAVAIIAFCLQAVLAFKRA